MPTRAEDEMEQVAQEGYDFPTNIQEILKRAFEAIAQQGVEEKGEEEEEINHEEYVLVCWFKFAGLSLLVQVCWFKSAGLSLLV